MNTYIRKVFVDQDQVMADFDAARIASGLSVDDFKLTRGSYRNLPEIEGALEAIDWLESRGFDVFVATKIPTHNPYAAIEKLLWIQERRPHLLKKTIITPHKGLLGCQYDTLIDDRPHKAHCREFEGTLLTFGPGNEYTNWAAIRGFLDNIEPVVSTLSAT